MDVIERYEAGALRALEYVTDERPDLEDLTMRVAEKIGADIESMKRDPANHSGAVADLMCREQEIKTLCGLLERAYRICGPDDLAEEIRTTLDALGGGST